MKREVQISLVQTSLLARHVATEHFSEFAYLIKFRLFIFLQRSLLYYKLPPYNHIA